MNEHLKPGDIFLTRGRGFISRAIRFFTRSIGESRTKVNHVGLVVEGGSPEEAVVVEALSRVVRHPLTARYGGKRGDEVAVYRALTISPEEVRRIVKAAERYLGKEYGYFKIVLHFLDWLLQGAYVFRRLGRMDPYPICSWLVAYAYDKVGKWFGVPPEAADPDHIWDYLVAHPAEYMQIRPLRPLAAPRP